jgi:hypothetical protein
LLAIGAILAPPAPTPAAVTESQFPPNTVRDLIAICAADKEDPRMTAAVNFCHGFVEGAVIVEEANEAHKGARKLFCLPSPRPPRGSELTSFIAWANDQPARLDMPSIDGIFIYLAQKFPCPAEAPRSRRAR